MPGSIGSVAPISTVLEPAERFEVDRVGAGLCRAVHRDSVADVLHDLRVRRVSAVVLSASRCLAHELPRTSRIVREFPGVPTLLLVGRHGGATPEELLAIGNCGVQHVVDVRTPGGWTRLREALAAGAVRDTDERALHQVMEDLTGAHNDTRRFIAALFAGYAAPRTIKVLASSLGVLPSTMVSRFYRSKLPAPKRYLVYAGLVRAARLLENPGLSIADVSNHLDHSSPQSFARHVRTYLGLSAGEFRRTYTGGMMMKRFREELVLPYRNRLCALSPVVRRVGRTPISPRSPATRIPS
jgi:AraC-like DNA-binding protein